MIYAFIFTSYAMSIFCDTAPPVALALLFLYVLLSLRRLLVPRAVNDSGLPDGLGW